MNSSSFDSSSFGLRPAHSKSCTDSLKLPSETRLITSAFWTFSKPEVACKPLRLAIVRLKKSTSRRATS